MALLFLILLVAALVCFVLYAFSRYAGRVNLLGLGLSLWVLGLLLLQLQQV